MRGRAFGAADRPGSSASAGDQRGDGAPVLRGRGSDRQAASHSAGRAKGIASPARSSASSATSGSTVSSADLTPHVVRCVGSVAARRDHGRHAHARRPGRGAQGGAGDRCCRSTATCRSTTRSRSSRMVTAIARPTAVLSSAARHLCGAGGGARRRRHLRRDRLHGPAAHARDRHPDRARRERGARGGDGRSAWTRCWRSSASR